MLLNGAIPQTIYKTPERGLGGKPGSVVGDHLSGMGVTTTPLADYDARTGRRLLSCLSAHHLAPKWGLPSRRLSAPLVSSYLTVASLPVPAKPAIGGLHFCGTVLVVAHTGRYPATCPAEPGLSSGNNQKLLPAITCPTEIV